MFATTIPAMVWRTGAHARKPKRPAATSSGMHTAYTEAASRKRRMRTACRDCGGDSAGGTDTTVPLVGMRGDYGGAPRRGRVTFVTIRLVQDGHAVTLAARAASRSRK